MEAQDYVKALQASGLTQVAISEASGIPQPTISKILRGEVRDVLSRNYRKLQQLHADRVLAAQAQPNSDTRAAA